MRINGFEQIKAFYSWTFSNQEKGIKPQHVSLYLFLLNQNNRNNWVEWFKCPFDLAMTGSCISSKKTYYKCLNDLQDWRLIKYKKGANNWKAPLIKLEVLKDTSTVPQSKQVVKQLDEQLSTHIYKLITDNYELIEDNLESWINNSKNSLPSKEEFVTYALEKKSSLDVESVGMKYDSWVENGWKNGNDKPIKNWKSSLNNTIPYLKVKERNDLDFYGRIKGGAITE